MKTLPKANDLSEAELNIIIAEHCGILQYELELDQWWMRMGAKGTLNRVSGNPLEMMEALRNWGLPNYTQSLDAMHEAEALLGAGIASRYFHEIQRLTPRSYDNNPTIENFYIHAPSIQRARAFVVTIGRATL